MNKAEYIRKMYSILVPMCAKYGYYNVAAGMIAQSLQEGWNSGLAKQYFNYWGMKGESKDWTGPKVAMNNKAKTDPAVYRVYYSMEQGCEGYFQFLKYPRYKFLKNCATDIDYLDHIGPCGWNSNVGYGDRCKKHLKEVYEALSTSSVPTWVVGITYTTQQDLNLRREPDGDFAKVEDLTDNAKLNAFITPNGNIALKRGTRVTVKEICTKGDMTWLRIPSGWICGKNSRSIYVL